MVSLFPSNAGDHGYTWSCETRDYEIGICCSSEKHGALRGKRKDWLARHRDMSGWSDMSTRGLLFQ